MSKILIIEDEEPIRRVLVRILSDEDSSFEIQEASDGKKGIDLIKKESFDLVLCDIKMPKVDGIELLQRTRKTKPHCLLLCLLVMEILRQQLSQ